MEPLKWRIDVFFWGHSDMVAAESSTGGMVGVRRGAAIAWGSSLVLLVFVAAFDNQWLESWRNRQIGANTGMDGPLRSISDAGGGNSWLATPIYRLSLLSWRVSPLPGETGREFAGTVTADVLTILLTGLLVWLVCRGIGTARGRWPLFVAAWFAVAVAAGVSLIVGVAVDGARMPWGQGSTYYGLLDLGLSFAVTIGWLVGLTAVLLYNFTGRNGYESSSAAFQSPSGYDFGLSGLAADYGIGQTRTAPAQQQYYPPAVADNGEGPTVPLDPYNRG